MPFNLPTIDRDDISFGPARLFLGVAGATPTVDVGAITEDGVSVEFTSEMKDITQGNPKLPELTFIQSQNVMVKVTSIEWNFNNLAYALGAGVTTASAGAETFAWGGQPCPTELALHVQHQMCRSGNTINVYVWRAVGEGNTSLPFTHDEHQFEYNFKAMRADTDWAAAALGYNKQLISIVRDL
jgi:hypothetical protein